MVMHEPTGAVHPIDPVDEDAGVDRHQRRRLPLIAAGFSAVALFAMLMMLIRPADQLPPSPGDSTTAAAAEIPIAIPEATEPRPASPGMASSPDWVAVDPGRFQPGVTPWVPVWTGTEIVFQRTSRELVAFRPRTETWRELAPPPIHIAGDDVSALWAGDELVVWTDEGAAAWDPAANRWRRLVDWPLDPSSIRTTVWTGEEIVDIGVGVAVDPATGVSRELSGDRPVIEERASAVWVDGRVVVVPQGAVYDPVADTWRAGAASGLTSPAPGGAWTGTEVIAADHEMRAAAYDPTTEAWTERPDVPLPSSECAPTLHELGGRPLVAHCAGLALWAQAGSRWLPIALPGLSVDDVVSTGDGLYVVTGYGVYRLAAEVIRSGPRRLRVGASVLDVPDGWSVGAVYTSATGGGAAAEHAITVTLAGASAECLVTGIQADARSVIERFLVPGRQLIAFEPAVGGAPVEAVSVPAGSYDDEHHLVWATGSTDVVEVACTDPMATAEIARHVWSPWQDPG
jgi:hypothetical protein